VTPIPCRRHLVSLFAATLAIGRAAQAAPDAPSEPPAARPSATWELSLGYFGETVVHPGVSVALGRSLVTTDGSLVWVAAHGRAYNDPGFQTGASLSVELGYRFTTSGGLALEASVGVGWLETFLPGDVYTLDSKGGLQEGGHGARAQLMPDAAVGVGWDLSRRLGLPLRPFLKLGAFAQYPDNTHWLPHFVTEVGLAYTWDELGMGRAP
jgi:hypothetical protein